MRKTLILLCICVFLFPSLGFSQDSPSSQKVIIIDVREKEEIDQETLITMGTAICGGSAIGALEVATTIKLIRALWIIPSEYKAHVTDLAKLGFTFNFKNIIEE